MGFETDGQQKLTEIKTIENKYRAVAKKYKQSQTENKKIMTKLTKINDLIQTKDQQIS